MQSRMGHKKYGMNGTERSRTFGTLLASLGENAICLPAIHLLYADVKMHDSLMEGSICILLCIRMIWGYGAGGRHS